MNKRSKTEDKKIRKLKGLEEQLPALILNETIFFPGVESFILIQSSQSIKVVELSVDKYGGKLFLVVGKEEESRRSNKNNKASGTNNVLLEPASQIGVAAKVNDITGYTGHTFKVTIETLYRGKAKKWIFEEGYYLVNVEPFPLMQNPKLVREKKRLKALRSIILKEFETYIVDGERGPYEAVIQAKGIHSYEEFLYFVCSHLLLDAREKQSLLETLSLKELMEKLIRILYKENKVISEERGIVNKIIRDYLEEESEGEKISSIDNSSIFTSSGDSSYLSTEYISEAEVLRKLIRRAKMPPHALKKAMEELSKFERAPVYSPEESNIREYIQWLCSLPWNRRTKDELSLEKVRRVLDRNHFGLEKVKDRILDFLAVRILSGNLTKGPILCFVGPPGVGKTSLGRSIASALRRKFIRMSLGGIRDEAEIRGHMRTYVSSMPGRIIQNIRKVDVKNPVFVLDEIDKIGTDYRGDPASALLEVLDPEQNRFFVDHYLEVEFDLSEVFFIATANYEEDIPPPLYDRMEIIRIPGYTHNEKFEIAQRHLIPKLLKESGLKKKDILFTPEAITYVITKYTEEAGVRELERQLSAIVRKVARWIVINAKEPPIRITNSEVEEVLGPPIYDRVSLIKNLPVGIGIGLAWTPYGGTLQLIETTIMRGKGTLFCTGHLGTVMKESAHTALSYIRANAEQFNLNPNFYKNIDIHIHAPEASVPKDGPSAGITIVVSLLSALLKKPQKDCIAMSGEITLTGRVLPVGGIREKTLGALRVGIKKIIFPKDNEKDVNEIPEEVRREIDFIFVENIKQVIDVVFSA